MNNFDFLVIYLTCGAPLGVFYFLRNYKKQKGFQIWLKTFFTFIFWLPFGFQLLKNNLRKKFFAGKKVFAETSEKEIEISHYQKQFEEVLRKSDLPISVFEFREVFERYVGLTFAADCANTKTARSEQEIFRIANEGNGEIGAICLRRRNLRRLIIHQNDARQDFFQIISQLLTLANDKVSFVKFVADFLRLLKDGEAQSMFDAFLSGNPTQEMNFVASYSDYFLWNTETHKSKSATTTVNQLRTLTTATNLPVKD